MYFFVLLVLLLLLLLLLLLHLLRPEILVLYSRLYLHSFVTKSYKYGIMNALFKSRCGVRLGKENFVLHALPLHFLGIFFFTTASRTALGPTQPPIQWVQGIFSLGKAVGA